MTHTAFHLFPVALTVGGAVVSAWYHHVWGACIFVVVALIVAEIGAQTRKIVGAAEEIQKRIDARKDTLQ
jgi:hypothetical protein